MYTETSYENSLIELFTILSELAAELRWQTNKVIIPEFYS